MNRFRVQGKPDFYLAWFGLFKGWNLLSGFQSLTWLLKGWDLLILGWLWWFVFLDDFVHLSIPRFNDLDHAGFLREDFWTWLFLPNQLIIYNRGGLVDIRFVDKHRPSLSILFNFFEKVLHEQVRLWDLNAILILYNLLRNLQRKVLIGRVCWRSWVVTRSEGSIRLYFARSCQKRGWVLK